jgi:hypothetical protein
MDLEEQIRRINNPQEFVKLCNTLFISKYGDDFQIIEGTRADAGNDGYISSEKRILAMHCPVKPENKKDKDYINKIRSDLTKAKVLHDNKSYIVKKWTFITPDKLSNTVIVELKKMAEEYGIEGNHIEATTLSNELYQNPELINKFPWLHLSKIESQFDEIKELIKNKTISEDSKKKTITNLEEEHDKSYEPTEDFKEAYKIITNKQEKNSKTALKGIYYRTTDKVAQSNIIMALLRWFDPTIETSDEMLDWCEQGLMLADALNDKALKVALLGYKGFQASYKFSYLDATTAFELHTSNVLGIPLISKEKVQECKLELKNLQKSYNDAFKEALEMAKKLNRPDLLTRVLLNIGQAASTRFIHLNQLDIFKQANYEKILSKRAFMIAKDIYAAMNDKLGVGYAIQGLAASLFIFGEIEESKTLNKEATEIATEFNDLSLLQTSKWLEENLRTGKVPDYSKGERRELKI